jgi:TRAP-type C4-dicarboxylate transport system permease small subunit
MEDQLLDDLSYNKRLEVNIEGYSYLLTITKWSKFLAIVGFVTIGIILLVMIGMSIGVGALGDAFGSELNDGLGIFLMVFYIIILGLYIYPVWHLYKFSQLGRQGLENNDGDLLNLGFKHLKNCFVFIGWITLILLILYGLIFLFALLGVMS